MKKLTVALLTVFALTGCKLVVKPPTEGYVTTQDGSFTCPAGGYCIIDIVDIFFDQTFIAKSDNPDYVFKGWKKAPYRLCGGETEPCHLTTTFFEGHEGLMSLLESDEKLYLEPVFEKVNPTGTKVVVDATGKLVGMYQYPIAAGGFNVRVSIPGLTRTVSAEMDENGYRPSSWSIHYKLADTCDDVNAKVHVSHPNMLLIGADGKTQYVAVRTTDSVPMTKNFPYYSRTSGVLKGKCMTFDSVYGSEYPAMRVNFPITFPVRIEYWDL